MGYRKKGKNMDGMIREHNKWFLQSSTGDRKRIEAGTRAHPENKDDKN